MISRVKKSKWTNTLLAIVLIIAIGLVGLSGCKPPEPTTPAKTNTLTPTPTATAAPAASGSAQVYKNPNLKLSITFPASWSGKYRVNETDEGIYVYFTPREKIPDGLGFFFCIRKKSKDFDELQYDSIGGKREIIINGIAYFVGGPLDVNLPEDNPEFRTFLKLTRQVPEVVNSVKGINS